MEETQVRIGLDEFRAKCLILVQSMEDEPGVDLLKMFGVLAEG